MKTRAFLLVGLLLAAWAVPAPGFANKASVTIEAPPVVEKGAQVPVKIHVTHDANNFIHYTEWVEVKVNGKPVERWNFSNFSRPEGATFIREITVQADEPLEIWAEASCNLHGSAGPATARVNPAPEPQGETVAP
jgi:desulfoferrodoxin (superoxide reductase-like protein)